MSDYYARAAEKARANDGKPEVRAEIIASTVASLRKRGVLSGVTVEDDGFRVLVLVGQPSRGVAAEEWLAVHGGEP